MRAGLGLTARVLWEKAASGVLTPFGNFLTQPGRSGPVDGDSRSLMPTRFTR